MTTQQKQKLIIVYGFAAIFIGSCLWWDDPFLGLLSAGFILGFMANETFFNSNINDIQKNKKDKYEN